MRLGHLIRIGVLAVFLLPETAAIALPPAAAATLSQPAATAAFPTPAAAAALPSPAAAQAEPFKCPHTGGNFVFGQHTGFATLDPMVSTNPLTRNIAMNVFETLVTRDENNHPILDLAEAMTESPDRMTYTFRLRRGIQFHNGKPLTSADVAASFDRYLRSGEDRAALASADHWDTPDPQTFVIHMRDIQPTFLLALSAYGAPIVVIPAEERDTPAEQLNHPIGTGPYQFLESTPNTEVRLRRYSNYKPNSSFQDRTGFGGYKQACFDTVIVRALADPVAALHTAEIKAADNLSPKAAADLKQDRNIAILPVNDGAILLAIPNTSTAPTDSLPVRKAMQAALDMDKIMQAVAPGDYQLNVGFQFADQPDHTDAGKQTYNQYNPDLARKTLADAGYQNQPIILLTSRDDPALSAAATVVQRQLQAIGVNVQLQMASRSPQTPSPKARAPAVQTWNLRLTAWSVRPALGPTAVMQQFVPSNAGETPPEGVDDPDLGSAWDDMNHQPTAQGRQAAFARMQSLVLERAYAFPLGVIRTNQAVRANVDGYVPFQVVRLSNVWFSP